MREDYKTEYDLKEEFIRFADSRDVSIYDPILDGTLRRCKGKSKNSAWYIGSFLETTSGLNYLCVTFGDWASEHETKHVFKPNVKTSSIDREEIKFRQDRAKKEAEEAKKKLNEEAIELAKKILLNRTKADPKHPYLVKKQLDPYDLAMDGKDLFIPFRSIRGSIMGGQRITPKGGKYQILGTVLTGSVYIFGDLRNPSTVVYICEGWATGGSLHKATGNAVVVTFTASNLLTVAKLLKTAYPKVNFVVCGDDDHVTDGNPGRTKATAAAKIFMNRAVFPSFLEWDGKNTTDFNDLHVIEGLDELKDQLCLEDGEKITYRALGQNGSYHYFYSYKNYTIQKTKAVSNTTISELIPFEISELETLFPKPDGSSGVYWDQAKAQVIAESMDAGIFTPHKVRGVGAWKDNKATVVNTGSKLIVDGTTKDMSDIHSTYTYTASQFSFPEPPKPLTVQECKLLIMAVKHFSWECFDSIPLFLGWIATARVSGALLIRPRLWVTAGEGCGKSILFNEVLTPALGGEDGFLKAGQDTTAAGIRQTLQGDSLPVIYDEFETESNNYIQQGIIEFLRQSWSPTSARMYKGTTSGTALNYDPQVTALVCSIKVYLKSAQDKGRFSILELARHNSNPTHEANLLAACEKITPEYGLRLFARAIEQIDNINEGYKVFKKVILQMGHTSRYADQTGMLLASYFSLTSDEAPTEDAARNLCMMMECLTNKDLSKTERDEELCLNHLLTSKIKYAIREGDHLVNTEDTVANIIQSPFKSELEKYGMKYLKVRGGQEYLAVLNNHVELSKVFAGSHWKNWNHSLARLEGALKRKTVKLSGKVYSSVFIPIDLIIERDEEEEAKVWALKSDANYGDETFLAGTQIELINNLFQCNDIERDAKVGISRQIKNDPSLKVIKLSGKYRTIDSKSIHLIPKSS